jgi:hypothetical protein
MGIGNLSYALIGTCPKGGVFLERFAPSSREDLFSAIELIEAMGRPFRRKPPKMSEASINGSIPAL